MSMISEKIVMEIGFKPIGDTDIISVSSQPIKTGGFMVRLDIPISQNTVLPDGKMGSQDNLFGKEVNVGKLPYNPVNHDILTGMDFIRLFHITMYGNSFILGN